jgi:hypothetical protein
MGVGLDAVRQAVLDIIGLTAVAPGAGPTGRSYDMDAAFMSFQLHGSGNHAVRVRFWLRRVGQGLFPVAAWRLVRCGHST